ncbi:MAG: hypothetical protein ABSA53_27245 [Streptosporangiaceae bacterium]
MTSADEIAARLTKARADRTPISSLSGDCCGSRPGRWRAGSWA